MKEGLHKGDCLEAMRLMDDNYIDLVITDPPYGIKESAHRNQSRTKLAKTTMFREEFWDHEIPSQEYFDQLFRVSKHQIIWGINYFLEKRDLPVGPGRIIWDKCNLKTNFSDCEIAYCSKHTSTRLFRFMWSGMLQGKSVKEGHIMQGNKKLNEKRYHPTQKPVALYCWLISKYLMPGQLVLDTHTGSGSSLLAYERWKIPYIAYEIDPHYYKIIKKRLELQRSEPELEFET